MAGAELIDAKVSVKQCKLAVEALHGHELKKAEKELESELLPGKEPNVWLNVTVKQIPSGHKFKPYKIPITHPLIDPRTTPICLITKDPQREYKDLLETHNIKFISRVVGIEKLKGKFKPFEARRMLLKENGLFLADERIIPLLPKLLGVKWFEAKKQPIPVCMTRKDLKGELERAVSSTYMNQNRGTCTSVKIATLSHTPAQILVNLKVALPAIAKHVVGGWDNIQALHIKTNSSVSLPIWSCTLDAEGGRWAELTAAADEEASGSSSDTDAERVPPVKEKESVKGSTQSKGKKRTQDGGNVEVPKKKAKGAKGQPVTELAATTVQPPSGKSTPGSKPLSAESTQPPKSKKRKSEIPAPTPKVVESTIVALESSSVTSTKQRTKNMPIPVEAVASASPAPKLPKLKGILKKESIQKAVSTQAFPSTPAIKVKGMAQKKASPTSASTTKPSLTKEELKQKRSGAPGEKKKSKINLVGGKSAKDRILGKKAAQ